MSTSQAEPTTAPMDEPPRPQRRRVFVALLAVVVLTLGGYVAWAATRGGPVTTGGGVTLEPGSPAVIFQNLAEGDGVGEVAVAPLGAPDAARSLTGLRCDRVHYAAGHGVCLAAGAGFPPIEYALLFGPDFRVTAEVPLDGLPSRARVSPDGRYGTATVFVTGHSYAQNDFSTSTTLIDLTRGTALANLEDFTILRDGIPFTAPDVNFWGVTFAADSNHFFATLATGGRTHLVEGNVAARQVVVGRENVECPSLSPDGTRLGFKKRIDDGGGAPVWRFHVLDLSTGRETPLAETRSIDDQLEWLDADTVVYGSPDSTHAVFRVPADGSGEPRRLLSQALSPAVLRTPLPDATLAGLVAVPRATAASTDVGITLSAPGETALEEPIVHVLRVTNRGPFDATRVVAEDVVAGPGRVVSATADTPPGVDGYGCAVVAEENRVQCDLARLPAGVTWTVTVTVSRDAAGPVEGRAVVGAAEPDPVDDGAATVRTDVG
jgi:hypothetical protein